MISAPLKATNEIDWIQPLKQHIHQFYGDDPERYAEECATLNRLRQDMRGAGKDSAAGRDLLYRYYGQLELLDLRFPVDENHIKISFTWFDAFTHKPTSQYSLAYEKASIIFNISAVLSCHAAHQTRSEDSGLKTAYHSFQASAGMFTYINENFLHAPSTDLSRDTVKTLIQIMLAQGQEVFLEKQIADGKKVGLLAKLASQAAYLYAQAVEGTQENVNKAIFEKVWLLVVQLSELMKDNDYIYHQTVPAEAALAAIPKLPAAKAIPVSELSKAEMRSKYEGDWTQQPSSRLTSTLKSDIRNYHDALEEAARSDNQLYSKMRQHEVDFDEMRSAGEVGEADVLFQKALIQVAGKSRNVGSPVGGEGNLLDDDFEDRGMSVMDQVARVEEILKKLNLIKRERAQVLKDLKEKEMKDTVDSLDKNVETFVNNRRSEGAQLLNQIAEIEAQVAKPIESESVSEDLWSGFSASPSQHSAYPQSAHSSFGGGPQNGSVYPSQPQSRIDPYVAQKIAPQPQDAYNPGMYPPVSPPPTQTTFSQSQQNFGRPMHQPQGQQQYLPQGYVPPPPPRGPPPLGPQQTFQQPGGPGHGEYGYGNQQRLGPTQHPQSSVDPWAGLNAWK
ncbi:BRO1-domain-containing protein [Diplocarpon rosae]|nr:BRO1-domain-containing protein [Diplocarpon rosae]